jgi:hypothetical protein
MRLDTAGRRGLLVGALVAGLASARALRADDFTFNVPVDLKALTIPVVGGTVVCTAGQNSPSDMGRGQTSFNLTNGSYQGTVLVHFNKTPGSGSLDFAKRYECTLRLREGSGSEHPPSLYPRKEGAPYADTVQGTITH